MNRHLPPRSASVSANKWGVWNPARFSAAVGSAHLCQAGRNVYFTHFPCSFGDGIIKIKISGLNPNPIRIMKTV